MSARRLLLVLALLAACKKERPPAAAPEAATDAESAPAASVEPPEVRRDAAARLLADGTEPSALKARAILQEVVRQTPSDAFAWYNLGVAAWRTGALDAAAEAFERATARDAKLLDAWYARGVVEVQRGRAADAVTAFERGLKLAPDDMRLHEARIGALRAAGRSKDAVEAAKQALSVDARSLPVYNQMGLAWLDLGDTSLARFVFEKAETVEGAEKDPVLQANFGWALRLAGERYAAQKRLEQAVALDPAFVPGLVYLARFYLEDRNYVDAIPLLEGARRQDPTNHGVLVDLGIAYRGVGRFAEAQEVWERALELRPDDPTPLFDLGILLGDDLKRYDEAVERFRAYVAAGGPEAARAQAYVEAVLKEKEKAERLRKREEERLRKQAEKEAREKLLEEERKKAGQPEAPSQPVDSPWGPLAPAEGGKESP